MQQKSMAPQAKEDWSDSDEEDVSRVESSVLLGVPDGNIDVQTDIVDAAVSRIGGLPVRASSIMYYHPQDVLTYLSFFFNIYLPSFDHQRPCCLRLNPPFHPLIVNRATNRWSSWSRCGVLSRIALWIGLCTFGVVRERGVNAMMAGTR